MNVQRRSRGSATRAQPYQTRGKVFQKCDTPIRPNADTPIRLPLLGARAWSYFPSSMSSLFGVLFRVATWGESHGGGVGAVVDGCPPRIPLSAEEIQVDLNRRRPGQSEIVSPRDEEDKCQILSGIFQGLTL